LGQGFKHKKIHHILCISFEWWNNKLVIVLSTMDVEYMTMSQAIKETMWLHSFLDELEFTQKKKLSYFPIAKGVCHSSRIQFIILRPST
jgi:hypothetical protein